MIPLWALFSFFLLLSFSPVFYVFFLVFFFSCFLSFFVHVFIFRFFNVFHFLFSFFRRQSFFFSFFFYYFHIFLLLAIVSEFNCFLRSRCSMEMWCPDDIGRESWDWVGPPAWVRACFNSPEWRGGSSPVKTEPPQIVLLLLWLLLCCCCGGGGVCCRVEWLYYSKRIIIVRWADLISDFFFDDFRWKNVYFVSRPMKIVTFLLKNDYTPKRVVDFHLERDTFRNKIMEIVNAFDEKITTTTVNPGNRRGFCV